MSGNKKSRGKKNAVASNDEWGNSTGKWILVLKFLSKQMALFIGLKLFAAQFVADEQSPPETTKHKRQY